MELKLGQEIFRLSGTDNAEATNSTGAASARHDPSVFHGALDPFTPAVECFAHRAAAALVE